MYRKFKLSLLMMTVFVAGCETYNLERPRESLAAQKQTDLINRSEVIAVVNSADVAADLEQQAARWGYDLIRKEVLAGLDLYLLTFDCPPSIDPHVASVELERLQPLSTVEANHKYVLQSAMSDVPLLNSISPRKYANSLIEWPAEGCEALYNIGIIDGGGDTSSLVVSNSAAIESRAFISGKKAIEAQRHGTAIAEIQFSGVEPMLKALDWMVSSDVRVVNISLAGPYNRTLDRGIQRAADKGIIIVAAVGNDGAQSSPLYPAALKDVIAATAVDSNADIYNKAVHGRHVDVSAPGVEVFVGDPNTGRYVSGTSIAAPFVAAKIASDPRYVHAKSTSDVKNILSQGAIDLGVAGPDDVFGVGLMQADKGCHQ